LSGGTYGLILILLMLVVRERARKLSSAYTLNFENAGRNKKDAVNGVFSRSKIRKSFTRPP
jgi:hypothetical protein